MLQPIDYSYAVFAYWVAVAISVLTAPLFFWFFRLLDKEPEVTTKMTTSEPPEEIKSAA